MNLTDADLERADTVARNIVERTNWRDCSGESLDRLLLAQALLHCQNRRRHAPAENTGKHYCGSCDLNHAKELGWDDVW